MATLLKNLSDYNMNSVADAKDMKFGIVVAEWNAEITEPLLNGAYQTLLKHGTNEDNIVKKYVPGTFELTLGAQFLAEYTDVDAIIVLGCVIQGETRHFDYICQGVTQGVITLNMKYNKPVIFGVLTTNTLQQAKDRAGGKHGNKGDEAAFSAIQMVALKNSLNK
ncbi:MAG TPA: 6,7-dimethyl-8-ribityllumazine synthase [Marinilabiliales bacterium]|jgi:6,7-dimethyl-8-ribityllumazine synthase|nr:6,7-dimethyl-8-ribityllumazine synthase [Marinilabiliales bacterium]